MHKTMPFWEVLEVGRKNPFLMFVTKGNDQISPCILYFNENEVLYRMRSHGDFVSLFVWNNHFLNLEFEVISHE